MCTTETVYKGRDAYTAIACNYVTGGVNGSCDETTERAMALKMALLDGHIGQATFAYELDMLLWTFDKGPFPEYVPVPDNRIISPNMAYADSLNAMFGGIRDRGEYDGPHNDGGYTETVSY